MIELKDKKDYIVNKSETIKVTNNNDIIIYDYCSDSNVELYVEEGSTVNYIITKSKNSKRVFNVDGTLNIISIYFSNTNEDLLINLNKENATTNVKNLVICNGVESNFIQYVKHNSKVTFSNIENIGIAFDSGNITFDTTGKIEKGMSKSKCAQLSRGIVMDNKSTVTAKPILLIDEYDCFANHGASIGKMSDDDLFYLMSRGLNKDEAFLLILQGIVRPFIVAIPNEILRNEIEESVNKLILR